MSQFNIATLQIDSMLIRVGGWVDGWMGGKYGGMGGG